MSTTFRTPVEQPTTQPQETKAVEKVVISESAEKPPTLYREDSGKPYLTKVLDVEGTFNRLDEPTRLSMEDIDEHYNEAIKSGLYDNTATGYREFWKELTRKVGVQHAPLRVQVGKIKEFIGYLKRSKEYERQ
jgi:hypothetical protein